MRGGRLGKRRVHGRHGLAAFLAVPVAVNEQCMVSQHCMAASGVDMAKQSNAYVAKATVITASRIGLIRLICNQGRRVPN